MVSGACTAIASNIRVPKYFCVTTKQLSEKRVLSGMGFVRDGLCPEWVMSPNRNFMSGWLYVRVTLCPDRLLSAYRGFGGFSSVYSGEFPHDFWWMLISSKIFCRSKPRHQRSKQRTPPAKTPCNLYTIICPDSKHNNNPNITVDLGTQAVPDINPPRHFKIWSTE